MSAIEVANLRREFRVRSGLLAADKRVIAVDDVTFAVPSGRRARDRRRIRLRQDDARAADPRAADPDLGTALVEGKRLFDLDRKARARLIQPVFQDPFASLNPRRRAGTSSRCRSPRRERSRAAKSTAASTKILERVGLSPRWASACRRSSPAGSASAPRSRARSYSSRAS
jgi:peptide/nickel transport system ATP-binding protein